MEVSLIVEPGAARSAFYVVPTKLRKPTSYGRRYLLAC